MERAPKKDAPKGREPGSLCRTATMAGYLLLAAGLTLPAGCATVESGKVAPAKPASAAAAKPVPPTPTGPSVEHFTGDREGFLIKEPSRMDTQTRADFDQARAMIAEGKSDQAIALLEKVIVRSPKLTAPHIDIAIAYDRVNKPAQAEQHLKKALELIPGHPVASNEYGLLLRKEGRFAESRAVFEKSLAIFPEYLPIHRNLGILCDLYLNDLACALDQYEIYSKAMPKDKQVTIWLADLHNRMGTSGKASTDTKSGTVHP